MNYETIYQPDPDEYQKIWPLIKDFATKPLPRHYEDIFAQRIATAGKSAKVYLTATFIYLIVSSVIMALLGERYKDIVGVATTVTPDNLPLIIIGNIQFLVVLFFYFIILAGIVHVSSTVIMRGNGEFDKIIFALFAVLGLSSLVGIPAYMVLIVLAQLGSSIDTVLGLVWNILLVAHIIYLFFCFILSVKTVYRFSWLQAIGGGIVVPLIIIGSCIGTLIYTWSGSQ